MNPDPLSFPLVLPAEEDPLFERIADALVGPGYIVLSDILPPVLVDALREDLTSLDQERFRPAGIGRSNDFQRDESVRTDQICWLVGSSPAAKGFLAWMDRLRSALNRRLFMGLFDYEAHYATYPVGAFYKRHLDAFKGSSNRILSTVFYLNPDWQATDGGELILYDENGARILESIAPECGKLVIFLSEAFPHEVLEARRERYSIAGWFRVNTSSALIADPPK